MVPARLEPLAADDPRADALMASQTKRADARQGLRAALHLALEHQIEFLLLFAADSRLYERNGYQREPNTLRWVKIHEHKIIGIGEEPLEELMVKRVTGRSWPEGTVDLLGHQA